MRASTGTCQGLRGWPGAAGVVGWGENVPVTDGSTEPRKPIEHRPPTERTVKQLYGTAFRCAEPSCTKPLYRVNDDTGEYILNSRVAHIHARREGGPRWNSEMSEKANRSAGNLLPLCEERAFEIDATQEHFSPEKLREWKKAQLAEYRKMQKSWPLTDVEAAEVIDKSFDARTFGTASAGAATVLAAARAVGLLIETCRQQRRLPSEIAGVWRAWREQVAWSIPAYDREGNRLRAEPPMVETRAREARLSAALADVVAALEPMAAAIVAELHAVRAADERLARWCKWVKTATAAVITAAGRWPGNPPTEEDEMLSDAITELQRASAALSAAWRQEQAAEPPEPAPSAPEPVETGQQRLLREHRELLETARPWARTDRRPHDAGLYARLIVTAQFAVGLPRVLSLLSINLEATARLAAAVARNADDSTYRALITDAVEQRPLAVAVNLIRQLMFTAQNAQRDELATDASEQAIKLLREETWQDPQIWSDNQLHVRPLLGWTASVNSDSEVRATIATAIENNTELLPLILRGTSEWVEHHDSNTWIATGLGNQISDLPSWFPTEKIIAEIQRKMPDLAPAEDEEGDDQLDELQRLASQVLRLTQTYNS